MHPGRRRRVAALAAGGLLVLGLGYGALDVADVVPGPLTGSPLPKPSPPAPGARLPGSPAPAVLTPLARDAPTPTDQGVAAALAGPLSSPAVGPLGVSVRDAATGTTLLDRHGSDPRTAASTAKLLTAAAVLSTLEPDRTLSTEVVSGTTDQEVVLVGGGDVLLAAGHGSPSAVVGHAGLADLADQTAAALRAAGRGSVAVRLDDSFFAGPAMAPGWTGADVANGFVAPVTALAVDAGRVRPGRYAPRHSDPAMSAANTLAALLAQRRIQVSGPVPRVLAPSPPRVLARVESAPVGDVVEYLLTESDNTVAEAMARMVADHAGRPRTGADAAAAVSAQVARIGVRERVRLVDSSGLSTGSAVAPAALTHLLSLAASPEHPELRRLLTGLPVAGATGTLSDRFTGPAQLTGSGLVRAKTGSLTGISALAGVVRDADGRLLTFALLADRVPAGSTERARAALDQVATVLAGCGCRPAPAPTVER